MKRVARTGRLLAALAFVSVLVAGGVVAGARSAQRHHVFSHRYPPNPRSLERPAVTNAVPRAALARTIRSAQRFTSLAALAYVLPNGTLVRLSASAWRLNAPVDLTRRASLVLHGGTLTLAPGAFLQARAGGTIVLAHMTIAGGRSSASRGFLVARDGGRLVLHDDLVRGLGHLGALAYGIAFRNPAAGSSVDGSRIVGNYFGVFLSHAGGVSIVGNTIVRSRGYGIDPYGGSHDDLIAGNTVIRPGLHGIVLARQVVRVRVVGNRIVHPGTHGIVLFDGAQQNTVVRNTVVGAFDGIVVTHSSRNRLVGNRIVGAARFGVRVWDGSTGNVLLRTSVTHALLGVYVYAGATDTRILDSVFAANIENVRIRRDAGATIVSPRPAKSELR